MGRIVGSYLLPHPPIIIEEIGKGEEGKAKATLEGTKKIAKDIKDKSPDTIIVITPHGPLFSDAISISIGENLTGDFGRFGHGELAFQYENDLELVKKIIHRSNREGIIIAEIDEYFAKNYNITEELDHGVLVPLYFVDKEYKDYKLIHITYGLLSPKELYRFGEIIEEIIQESNKNVAIIASGDLSHRLSKDGPYSYSPAGKEFDEKIMDIVSKADMEGILTFDLDLGERAGECGLRSLMILAGILGKYEISSKVLSYEGPFGVGYGTAKFQIGDRNKTEDILKIIEEEEENKIQRIRKKEGPYVKLARESLEYYLKEGKYLESPDILPKEMLEDRKGVFVTLKKDGILRGCIGTIEPTEENIASEIIKNAVSAGIRDPRFNPVELEELSKLTYSVDILFEPEIISSMEELDINKYGVIVSKDYRKGLLLPNLEGIDTVEEQVKIALDKAGIKEYEKYIMERFKVVRNY